jgi:hypothetical protein
MPTGFYWNDSWLRAAAAEAYRISVAEAAGVAKSRAPWAHVAASISPTTDGIRVSSPDAALAEGGAKPHTIDPAGGGPARVLKFKTGGFASGPVSHPGFQGTPFMREAALAWPELFVSAAKVTFPG